MKTPVLYLIHIEECLRKILDYTGAGREAFVKDRKTQDAVVRNFEVIGEAAKRLPVSVTGAHPDVPWKRIAGFRDVLIHAYDRVDADEVWNIVERDVAGLLDRIGAIRKEIEERGGR